MNSEILLNQIIAGEIKKIELEGKEVRLKPSTTRLIFASLFFGLPGISGILSFGRILFGDVQEAFASLVGGVIYIAIFAFILRIRISRDATIRQIAKKAKMMPDTPIDEIIRGAML